MRGLWVAAIAGAIGWGIALGLDDRLPRHFGWYLAGLCLLAGLVFGVRGLAVELAGFVACGIAALIVYDPGGGEDQSGLIAGVAFIWGPLLFALPLLVGALVRWMGSRFR